MKIMRLLCVLWACTAVTLEAGAAESAAHGASAAATANRSAAYGASAAATANRGQAAGGKAGGAARREPAAVAPQKAGGSTGSAAPAAHAPRPVFATPRTAPAARGNAERLHPVLSAKAPGGIVKASRRGESTGSAPGNGVVSGPRSANPMEHAALPVPKIVARAATSVKAFPRDSIGGPRAAGPGGLGGPATGRTARNTGVDGTPLHRKF